MGFQDELEKLRATKDEVIVDDKELEKEVSLEPEKEIEEKPASNEDFAKLRIETAAKERRIKELESVVEEAKKPKADPVKVDVDAEPNKSEDPDAWNDWRIRALEKQNSELGQKVGKINERFDADDGQRRRQSAIQSLASDEHDFMKSQPDYEPAAEYMKTKMMEGIKYAYPRASDKQVEAFMQNQIIEMMAQFKLDGQNPGEGIYQIAKERFGYVKAAAEPDEKKKPAVDLKAVEKNQKKSATGAKAGGHGSNTDPSIEDVGGMGYAQFSKLTPAQRAQIKEQAKKRA